MVLMDMDLPVWQEIVGLSWSLPVMHLSWKEDAVERNGMEEPRPPRLPKERRLRLATELAKVKPEKVLLP